MAAKNQAKLLSQVAADHAPGGFLKAILEVENEKDTSRFWALTAVRDRSTKKVWEKGTWIG